MNKELTIEHLAAYLPYGVKVKVLDPDRKYPYQRKDVFGFGTLCGVTDNANEIDVRLDNSYDGSSDCVDTSDCKLLLRPLSQLTETIEHGGERFVPMIELIHADLDGDEEYFVRIKDKLTISRGEWEKHLISCAYNEDYIIEFDCIGISFRRYQDGLGWDGTNIGNAKLISMLHSWHFDTSALTEAELAEPIPSIPQP